MAREDPQVNIRLPVELKQRLEEAATSHNRSLTAEVVARLEQPNMLAALVRLSQEVQEFRDSEERLLVELGTTAERLRQCLAAMKSARVDAPATSKAELATWLRECDAAIAEAKERADLTRQEVIESSAVIRQLEAVRAAAVAAGKTSTAPVRLTVRRAAPAARRTGR